MEDQEQQPAEGTTPEDPQQQQPVTEGSTPEAPATPPITSSRDIRHRL